MRQFAFYILVLISSSIWSQTKLDSLQQLEEVVVKADVYLKTFSNTQTVSVLKDSVISRSTSSLTNLLNYNSGVYFKENGLGMVSSPSFRGTTAQQTAVTWNGVNINSQFNGQTDFNTINIRNFDDVTVRSGGGSALYGSGAIGGSIHLNNQLKFNTGFKNTIYSNYGSFNSWDVGYKSRFSTNRFSVDIALSRAQSDNDYEYVDSEKENLNGAFYNQSLSANFAYKLNSKNILKLYSYLYDGERHFSLIFSTETPTKYQDVNSRTMLEWLGNYGRFTSTLKVAYLTETYKYFPNIKKDLHTFGEAKTLLGKYNLDYKLFNNASLQSVIDVTHTTGEGSSIGKINRTISGFSLLFKQQLKNFLYEATLRQEVTNNYESPLLYSLGLKYNLGKHYSISINGSKNFRIPTYNDLYWEGSGNTDLKPETSYQVELGQELSFKNIRLKATGFYNDITDMIRWLPSGNLWQPINTDHVVTYGLESQLDINVRFQSHKLSLGGNYTYTISENQDTDKQLIYVPEHKASMMFNYQYKRVSLYYQALFVGDVFTLSDNNPKYTIDAYTVSNVGFEYALGKEQQYVLGAQAKNIFNEDYQSVANRFMPGIHYNFYLNFNF